VKGEPYGTGNPIPMPPGGLTDQQTADVLTYVRGNFGNNAGPVTAEQVGKIRQEHQDRNRLWTVPELKAAQ
jgi:mono/diheme cytochrome c family protein